MREAMWGPVGYCSSSTCSIENDESERGMIKHWCPSIGIYLRERERERPLGRRTVEDHRGGLLVASASSLCGERVLGRNTCIHWHTPHSHTRKERDSSGSNFFFFF